MATMSKKRKVINYLTSGKGLTENEARSRFGVGNFRATMSNIRHEFEKYGNWKVTTEETTTGKSRYYLDDIHPGTRMYGYDKHGTRYMI
jgi:hypothetical protein